MPQLHFNIAPLPQFEETHDAREWPVISTRREVFKRTTALERLLESASVLDISTAYVADDGERENRSEIYEKDWPFDLEIIDLEYDAGVGAGRHAIVEQLEEPYLMMADPDITLPPTITSLTTVLEDDASLGAVAPLLIESGRPKAFCHDFAEAKNGSVLRRGVWKRPPVETIAERLLLRWDFIPNTAVYRREALADYHWDPAYVNAKDHLDMFVGHWKRTDWEFGICPEVIARHADVSENSEEYQLERGSRIKAQDAKSYFLEKWSYRQVLLEGTWFDWERYHPPAPNRWLSWAPIEAQVAAMDVYDWLDRNYL